jgi:hypothetical protein
MPSVSLFLTDTTNSAHSTTGTLVPDHTTPGVDAQGLTITLVGIAGALFVFAAINTLGRTATAKVRKR